MSEFTPDTIVQKTIERFLNRAKFGKEKYGTDLDRTDLMPEDWAQHAIEEAHDLMLYLEKWREEQEKGKALMELLIQNFKSGLFADQLPKVQSLLEWYEKKS